MSDHKSEDLQGRVKTAVGDLTGDKGLRREGKVEQGAAATKTWIDEAADKIKKIVHPKP